MYRLCCLFIRNDAPRNYRDTRTLEHYPTPPPTISAALKKHKHTQREASRTRSIKSPVDVQTRRTSTKRGDARSRHPLIIVIGEELVAPDPTACEHLHVHHPAAWSGPALADRNRTAGEAVAPSSSSACSRWTPWVLTAIPVQASRCRT